METHHKEQLQQFVDPFEFLLASLNCEVGVNPRKPETRDFKKAQLPFLDSAATKMPPKKQTTAREAMPPRFDGRKNRGSVGLKRNNAGMFVASDPTAAPQQLPAVIPAADFMEADQVIPEYDQQQANMMVMDSVEMDDWETDGQTDDHHMDEQLQDDDLPAHERNDGQIGLVEDWNVDIDDGTINEQLIAAGDEEEADERRDGDQEYDDEDDDEEPASMLKQIASLKLGDDEEMSYHDSDDEDGDYDPNDDQDRDADSEEDDPEINDAVYLTTKYNKYLEESKHTEMDAITRGVELLQMRKDNKLPVNDGDPLHSDPRQTTGQWARGILQFVSDIDVTPTDLVLEKYLKTLPRYEELPIKPIAGKSLRAMFTAHSGFHSNKLFMEIQVCKRGCYVFGEAGKNKATEQCPVCSSKTSKRLTKSKNSKTPTATIHYRPLIPLLETLLHHDVFVKAVQHGSISAVKKGVIFDLLNGGKEIHKQRYEMKAQFDDWCVSNPGQQFEEISLVLGSFWDGLQVHSSIISSFYPTLVSIHSLPPSMRGILAVGTFLLALDTTNTAVTRDFLNKRCLLPELLKLEKGYVVRVNETNYYVQGRMLVRCLDTKALETMFCVQASTAAAPCPMCKKIRGWYLMDFRKCIFCGHRAYLPADNYLRGLCERGRDHPRRYFHGEESDGQAHIPAVLQLIKTAKDSNKGRLKYPVSLAELPMRELKPHLDDFTHKETALAVISNLTTRDKLCATSFKFDLALVTRILPILEYEYAELRELKYEKVSHDAYLQSGMRFDRQVPDPKKPKAKLPRINGVSGLHPDVHTKTLDYENQACFEGFHALQGACKRMMDNIAGKLKYSASYAKRTGCHSIPGLNLQEDAAAANGNKKGEAAATGTKKKKGQRKKLSAAGWVFTQRLQDECDVFVDSINLPVGIADHFEVEFPFKRGGYLKGMGKIQFIAYVLPTFLSTLDPDAHRYPDGYVAYFEIASIVIKGLIAPVFTEQSIIDLFDRVVQFLSFHEGAFPISECVMLVHELVDLPKFIAQYGPVRCWWALYGERAVSKIKRYVPRGGQSYNKTTMEQYMLHEESTTSKFYSSFDNLQGDKDFIRVCQQAKGNGATLSHTIDSKLFSSRLYSEYIAKDMNQFNMQKMHVFELKQLLECFTLEIEDTFMEDAATTGRGLERALHASAYYRVYYHFCKHVLPKCASKSVIRGADVFVWWLLSSRKVAKSYSLLKTVALPSRPKDIKDELERGDVIFEDFLPVIEDLRYLKVQLYRTAVLQGTRMNSRGWQCRQVYPYDPADRLSINAANVLKNNWNNKKHFSSWCKVKPPIMATGTTLSILSRSADAIAKKFAEKQPTRTENFAQINAFMVINMVSDKVLNRLSIASVTCRTIAPVTAKNRCGTMILCDDTTSLAPAISFLPLKDIVATRFGVVGYDSQIRTKPFPASNVEKFETKDLYSTGALNTAHHIVLCPLDSASEALHDHIKRDTFKMAPLSGGEPLILRMQCEERLYG